MARPTTQAQRAIDAMKATGMKRSDYSVNTERRSIGKGQYEFGKAMIAIYIPSRKLLPFVSPALSNGLDVTISLLDSGYVIQFDPTENRDYRAIPRLKVVDYTAETDEYGFAPELTGLRAWATYSDLLTEYLTKKFKRD